MIVIITGHCPVASLSTDIDSLLSCQVKCNLVLSGDQVVAMWEGEASHANRHLAFSTDLLLQSAGCRLWYQTNLVKSKLGVV